MPALGEWVAAGKQGYPVMETFSDFYAREIMLYPMIDRQSTAEERRQVFSSLEGETL